MSAPSPRGAILLALSLAVACQGTGDRPAPQSELEHGLFLSERDERGRAHPISADPGAAKRA